MLGADRDEFTQTRQQIGATIDVCMGGRVAEELVFGSDQVLITACPFAYNFVPGQLINLMLIFNHRSPCIGFAAP